jgi:transposase
MASIALDRNDVIVGVDTHKHEHVAVAIDGLGGRLGELYMAANAGGCEQLLNWARTFGAVHGFGVEGTGSYGIGLARFLRRHGETVIEVSRPPRAGERRLDGKSDPIDAENAARQVLAGRATSTPKLADGAVEAIRLTRIARNTAVKAHSQAIITLKATLVTASEELRGALEPLSDYKLMTACGALDNDGDPADPDVAMRHVLRSLARRWLDLHQEIKSHTKRLKALTTATAPTLVESFGIGPDIAGELLVAAGDNTDRIRSEAAFAKLCGACPVPAGSGKTAGRHRLNRGGNRQANAALYRTVIVRMRWHEPTITYVERRTAEGLTKKEIIRCLKRYLAREVYAILPVPPSTATLERATDRLDHL